MFSIYNLVHFHLQAIILVGNTDSLSAMELLEHPEERLHSVRWETYAGLVNWFSNVILMQIRHGCSWLNHDYTKSRILGHKASHNIYSPSACLLIGFLGVSASPDHLPPGCSQLSRCPTHCELEAHLMSDWGSKTNVWAWSFLNELITAVAAFCKAFPQVTKVGFLL